MEFGAKLQLDRLQPLRRVKLAIANVATAKPCDVHNRRATECAANAAEMGNFVPPLILQPCLERHVIDVAAGVHLTQRIATNLSEYEDLSVAARFTDLRRLDAALAR